MTSPRLAQTLFFWISRFFFIFALPLFISDVPGYLNATSLVLSAHQLPYRDFPLEYPPLAFALLLAVRAFLQLVQANSAFAFKAAMAAFLLPCDWALFRRFRDQPPFPRAAALYLVLTCLLAPLLYDRLDLLVAGSLALPFFVSGESRFALAWGIGGALKLAPASLLPLAWAEKKSYRVILLGALPLFLSLAVMTGLHGNHPGTWRIQGARGFQVECLPASLLLLFGKLGWITTVATDSNFGSQEVIGFGGLQLAWKAGYALVSAGMLFALVRVVRRDRGTLLAASWMMTLTLVAFSYVLSPQFVLWLVPLALLQAGTLEASQQTKFLAFLYATVAATSVHFLFYWSYAEDRALGSIALVVLRNCLLIAWWLFSGRALLGTGRKPTKS